MRGFYKNIFAIVRPFAALYLPRRVYGRENVPDGAAIVCANHSSLYDPLYLIYGLGTDNNQHFMAKKELFDIFFVGWVLKKIDAIEVDREATGVGPIREAMKYLKRGEKVMIFPEGTRVSAQDEADAKLGAVRLAMKLGVPILPVYVPAEKKPFRRAEIVIGEPYYISGENRRLETEEYASLSEGLMGKIYALEGSGNG